MWYYIIDKKILQCHNATRAEKYSGHFAIMLGYPVNAIMKPRISLNYVA